MEDPKLLEESVNASTVYSVKRGDYLIKSGDPLTYISFLYSDGVMRHFMISADGKEITDCFAIKRGQILWASRTLNDTVAIVTIEALTDAEVIKIPITEAFRLHKKYPELLDLEVRLSFESVDIHWNLKKIHFQYSAMERYCWFLENYPGLIDQINNKYIASFLDMTPVTLSRIRRKLREEGEEE